MADIVPTSNAVLWNFSGEGSYSILYCLGLTGHWRTGEWLFWSPNVCVYVCLCIVCVCVSLCVCAHVHVSLFLLLCSKSFLSSSS